MFDSHCHLSDLDDPLGALNQAQEAGVRSMLTCAHDISSNFLLLQLRARVSDLPVALGLHPWSADQDLQAVLTLIQEHRPCAVGELGLDLWDDPPVHPLPRQMEVLEAQLQLAVRFNLPVTLHSRKAIDPLLSAVRNHPGLRGALHAFSGSYEQLKPFLDLGLHVGIGGAVTRSRAKRVRRLAVAVPLDRIVLETDAPAIGLQDVEPPHVRPCHVVRVAQTLAELRNLEFSRVEQQTDANATGLFGPIVMKTPTIAG